MKLSSIQFPATIFALLCFFISTTEAVADVHINEKKFQIGDNGQWSVKAFNDSNWPPLSKGLPVIEHNYWVRVHLEVTDTSSIEQKAIFTSILGAYDIFWDDIKLKSNGVVGQKIEQEEPGTINFVTPIPDKLWTSGQHVISLRISNYYSPIKLRSNYFNIRIAPHQELSERYLRLSILPLIILGAVILIGGFFLLLHFLYLKRNTYALFSGLCFLIASLLIVEVWKPLFGYSYDWHIYRLYCVGFLTFLISLLLPIFLVFHLEIKPKKYLSIL